MQDFIRIGGAITSSPLNENFRRLLNAISISNTNLIFPDENAIVDTITDMHAIEEPLDAQTCYVISSGELYRYSKAGNGEWVKIADFGQTFRQGFLNSGAVVLEDYITLKEGSTTVLNMPAMLVYFKNQPGDNRYLKGMYLVEAKEFDVSDSIYGANAYSIVIDVLGEYTLISGMPKKDDPSHIFIGTILVDGTNNIIPGFVYTLPDIPFTADRGHFFLSGGQASGLNLMANEGSKVSRRAGFYYDEGINFTLGQTENYPIDNDNGANHNLKYYEAQADATLYYMTPEGGLAQGFTKSDGVIYNKYWNGSAIVDVDPRKYTIQQHLVTPNGQNIILYGDKQYNSLMDAESNINSVYGVDMDFPYVEATRLILGNNENFSIDNEVDAKLYVLGRLSQVGTISPEFADNVFKIYSGEADDITPSSVKFDLSKLQAENYNELYNLVVAPYNTTRDLFGLSEKYITDDNTQTVETTSTDIRTAIGAGYIIADNADLELLKGRIVDLEKEVWSVYDEAKERYEQSIRYRLFTAEERLDAHDEVLEQYDNRLTFLEQYKVHKNTMVNGYTLGDGTENAEAKSISIETGDIDEGSGLGDITNLWYTEARVSANEDVVNATKHINTISAVDNAASHTAVNPHNLSTDDIKYLTDTTKVFVTPEQERRIRADKLPDDTIQALADLDAKNMDDIKIDVLDGSSLTSTGTITQLGNVTGIRFYEDGANLSLTDNGETLVVEVKGQVDEDTVMLRNVYASTEMLDPTNPELAGAVDKAITSIQANSITGIEASGANKYYGTNDEGTPGIFDIARYVTTTSAEDYTDIDQITFVPVDGSVQEAHLETTLRDKINNNYHTVNNTGVLKSSEINTFNFGDNLTVSIDGNTATVNAIGTGSSAVTNFANLADVSVVYTGNAGKAIVINDDATGLVVSDAPSMDNYMLKTVYVDTLDITKVKKAVQADKATSATTATNASAVNNKSVDDTKTTNGVLWTAAQIISNTSSQIASEGVNTYSGTDVPTSSLGKDGDLYILIES